MICRHVFHLMTFWALIQFLILLKLSHQPIRQVVITISPILICSSILSICFHIFRISTFVRFLTAADSIRMEAFIAVRRITHHSGRESFVVITVFVLRKNTITQIFLRLSRRNV